MILFLRDNVFLDFSLISHNFYIFELKLLVMRKLLYFFANI